MEQQETAPPLEKKWSEHLKDLGDRELAELAKDYKWLEDEAHADANGAFHTRRQAIISECERRGMSAVAEACRRPGGE